LGSLREFGLFTEYQTNPSQIFYYRIWEIFIFAFMGCMGGVLGAIFIKLTTMLTQLRQKLKLNQSRLRRFFEVIGVAFIISTVWICVIYASPCENLPSYLLTEDPGVEGDPTLELVMNTPRLGYASLDKVDFPQLWCESTTQFSTLGQLMFVGLTQSMRVLVFSSQLDARHQESPYNFHFSNLALGVFFLLTFFFMVLTNGTAIPTGIFVPSMVAGSAFGRLFGKAVYDSLPADSAALVSLPVYTVVGSAALLGGISRMTLSLSVLVLETTGSMSIIVPIMVTVFAAKITGDFFNHGIYDTQIHMRGTPVLVEHELEFHQKVVAQKLNVGDLQTTQLLALPPVVLLQDAIDFLRMTTHSSFPITYEVDRAMKGQDFALYGTMSRELMVQMIERRVGFIPNDHSVPSAAPHSYHEATRYANKLDQVSTKTRQEDEATILGQITAEEGQLWVMDLRPFMQRSPMLVQSSASYSSAYALFRSQGPRNLFVTAPHPRVQGMVTRKDLMPENAALFLMDQAVEEGFLPAAFHRRFTLAGGKNMGEGLMLGRAGGGGDGDRFVRLGNPSMIDIPFIPDSADAPITEPELSPIVEAKEEEDNRAGAGAAGAGADPEDTTAGVVGRDLEGRLVRTSLQLRMKRGVGFGAEGKGKGQGKKKSPQHTTTAMARRRSRLGTRVTSASHEAGFRLGAYADDIASDMRKTIHAAGERAIAFILESAAERRRRQKNRRAERQSSSTGLTGEVIEKGERGSSGDDGGLEKDGSRVNKESTPIDPGREPSPPTEKGKDSPPPMRRSGEHRGLEGVDADVDDVASIMQDRAVFAGVGAVGIEEDLNGALRARLPGTRSEADLDRFELTEDEIEEDGAEEEEAGVEEDDVVEKDEG
jgi:hypothetical protein